ncbi:uncharacterized protein J3R85_007307 [Psidium guajava]|nr:uncharacterized protein J3R85_007307 [Psidium guajava]
MGRILNHELTSLTLSYLATSPDLTIRIPLMLTRSNEPKSTMMTATASLLLMRSWLGFHPGRRSQTTTEL